MPAPPHSFSLSERIARLRLLNTERVGPVTFHQLLARFGSAETALDHIPDLAARGGAKRGPKIGTLARAKEQIARAHDLGVDLLFHGEQAYPQRLAVLDDAPPVLYGRGHVHLAKQDCIGVVGTRNASANGLLMTSNLVSALSDAGLIIASGMARGIDTKAHQASLSKGTIACVAGGVDHIYPRENTDLYHQIIQEGLALAEMPLGTVPQARHFPRRNRLISGLSLGVLVVEAAPRSGSLITARLAGEQGREVFAVPGSPLDPRAQGTNRLIRDGAILVESADDILRELENMRRQPLGESDSLPLFSYQKEAHPDASPDAIVDDALTDRLLDLLSPSPTGVDALIRLLDVPAGTVMASLLALELAGRISRLDGGRVMLSVTAD